ncbi:sulfurtransferase TusA family protein [Oscillibacter sp.]|uniref:sulfurtransferase TusA family protein n=1 Tax=Oscillibacter sp. TaxID=1945593 RepID=UPI00289B1361|nr:sulfurtransferase TusA family protein [Oscillibacter sp.]
MIDARGYSCPTPVVMVQKEVKQSSPAELEVLVDNQCSVENVTRYAGSSGYQVSMTSEGRDFRLLLKK